MFLQTVSTKVLYAQKLPVHAVDLAKEYQYFPKFKDINLYIVSNHVPTPISAQRRVKTDVLNCVVINKIVFCIKSNRKLNITPNILLVIPEIL